MDDAKAKGYYESGKRALKKLKYQKAIDLFDRSLSFNPEYLDSLNSKGDVLLKLGRLEEGIQLFSKASILKLQKNGDIPSDINSIEEWINGAKELKKLGNKKRALNYLMQAAFLAPIVDKKGVLYFHHNNPKIYFEMALLTFNFLENYKGAMDLFNESMKYDPNLTIPEEIKVIYNEYAANRSGEGVKMIVPINSSNLRDIIPKKDKILASIMVSSKIEYVNITGSKRKIYTWNSHLLISDNGIAFQGAKPMCKLPSYYLPWESVGFSLPATFGVSPKAAKIKHFLLMYPQMDTRTKSNNYLQDLNLEVIHTKKQDELLRRTVIKLKSFDALPPYWEYIEQIEYLHEPMYKKIIKTIKKERKKK